MTTIDSPATHLQISERFARSFVAALESSDNHGKRLGMEVAQLQKKLCLERVKRQRQIASLAYAAESIEGMAFETWPFFVEMLSCVNFPEILRRRGKVRVTSEWFQEQGRAMHEWDDMAPSFASLQLERSGLAMVTFDYLAAMAHPNELLVSVERGLYEVFESAVRSHTGWPSGVSLVERYIESVGPVNATDIRNLEEFLECEAMRVIQRSPVARENASAWLLALQASMSPIPMAPRLREAVLTNSQALHLIEERTNRRVYRDLDEALADPKLIANCPRFGTHLAMAILSKELGERVGLGSKHYQRLMRMLRDLRGHAMTFVRSKSADDESGDGSTGSHAMEGE